MAGAQASFGPAKYKNAQREQWNQDGAAWRRWTPTLERWYGEATRQMVDLARVRPGQRVLDIAGDYVRVAREAFGGFNAMMAHLSAAESDAVWNEVEFALRSFESGTGFKVPGKCLVAAATK